MRRLRIAITGFGRLGRACARIALDASDLQLVGVVARPDMESLPPPFVHVPVVGHPRELPRPDATLLCVPSDAATGVACDWLQQRLPLIECAILDARALAEHYDAIGDAAQRHRVAAVVGAGWDPELLPLIRRAFGFLIPEGRTEERDRPGAQLHHTESARQVAGVKDAFATELRNADGVLKRYVYVELAKGTGIEAVRDAFARDALFAGEDTQVFEVERITDLEQAASGIVLERVGTSRSGAHHNLLLEGRFDAPTFAARVMLDAARRIERLAPGAHRYALWP